MSAKHFNVFPKLYFLLLLFCFILAMAEALSITKPGCQEKCGEVTIPYPFGIGSRCSFDRSTELSCYSTFNTPKLFFEYSIPYQVVNLSIPTTSHDYMYPSVRIKHNISRNCSDGSGASIYDSFLSVDSNTSFSLDYRNNLVVIGCNMRGIINGVFSEPARDSQSFTVGCITDCYKIENLDERQCPGPGCCQVVMPDYETGPYSIHVETLNVSEIVDIADSPRCSSIFLSDEEEYKFKASDILSTKDTTVLLNFRIGNQTCKDARKDPSSFACKGHSICTNDNAGYFCTCEGSFKGNPYLDPGCSNLTGKNKCDYDQSAACRPFQFKWVILGGAGLGMFILGVTVWIYYKKRKQLLKLNEKLDLLNARLLLIQEISSNAKIFTAKKLQQATNNFHESRILGQGGYGTVYRGILQDQSIVAVKKSKITAKSQFDEFINEVAILAKIDHRNIVKLLGCSVETEHPLLVYEFVSNGTLTDHIFKKSSASYYSSMSWETRLRIAAEVAGALAYLHSAASIPIIHRDVKSSNILLDETFTAKVADFGVSRVNHLDQTAISTLVKGTLGYLDPEYMQTSQLTEKSDVFSYGVVLAELLTGKKSISFERAPGERNLSIYFTVSMNEDRLLEIVEGGMVNEGNIKHVQATAALAQRCLNFKGEERPSMREVASELEALRGFSKKHTSYEKNNEVHLNVTSTSSAIELTMSTMFGR